MTPSRYEIRPVERITVGAIGEPGHRVFYLQAGGGEKLLTLRVEKEQVLMLALSIEQFLNDLQQRFPNLAEADARFEEGEMDLVDPLEPAFHIGNMGLGYDEKEDRLLFVLREAVEDLPAGNPTSEASLWCTRGQLRRLALWGAELARRGRPICGNCGNPIDPGGHFCPRRNGHKH
ncbi:MAG: DUF3090 domain-containing protein [Anaerolineales bacterium]|nr:DUF3090 domain-containing protein [Anaerolineales bacterium]